MFQALTKRGAPARGKAGFTVGELLAVIAVIVVLMGVAVPSAVAYQRSLSVAELDGKAEQVYNAAQFQLSSLKTAGRLDALASVDGDAVVPPDYTGSEGSDSIRYAVKGGDAVSKYLMPTQSTSVSAGTLAGSYVIELSPVSGEVYAVYYWEDGATNADGAAFSGASPAAVEAFYRSVSAYRPSNSGTFLADHHIGYFNGGAVAKVVAGGDGDGGGSSSSSSGDEEFEPGDLRLVVDTDDELRVRIYDSENPLNETDFDPDQLKLSIHVQELEWGYPKQGHEVMITLNDGASAAPTLASREQYIERTAEQLGLLDGELSYVLDSIKSDGSGEVMSIDRQAKGYIERGADIQITIYVEYEGFAMKFGPYQKNSLFGAYTPSEDGNEADIEISCLRHLLNLRDYSYLSGKNLVKSISFAPDSTISYDPALGAIEAIDLDGLLGASNSSHCVNGNNCTIEGLVIGDESDLSDNVGLFARVGVPVKDLTLKDVTVYGRDNVGALAGTQVNADVSITNCKVVGGTVTGRSAVGGLVGNVDSCTKYELCAASADVVATGSSGDGSAGGLVGVAKNSVFSNCTVGSVSQAVSVTGRNCSNVGGFVGRLNSTGETLSGCQAYANVSGVDYVGGFVGSVAAGSYYTFEGCQAAVTYDSDGGSAFQSASGRSYVGGFAGSLPDPSKVTACLAQLNVSGTGDYVGGFGGYLKTTGTDGIFTGCTVPGAGGSYPTYSGAGEHVDAFASCDFNGNPKSMRDCWSKAVRS